MNIHLLKIEPQYFRCVMDGSKTFEIRKNDRDYKVGDALILSEYGTPSEVSDFVMPFRLNEDRSFSGKVVIARISYISTYEQKKNYVVLGLDIRTIGHILDRNSRYDPLAIGGNLR